MNDPLDRTTVSAFNEPPLGPATAELSGLVDRLAQEMVAAWDRGDYVQVEDLLAGYPALAHHADLAIELAYEELCLRQQHGRKLSDDEFLARFPQWRSQLKMLLDCHHAFARVAAEPAFPPVGETFGEFRLLAELGHGTQGRVYLAEQPSLSDRPVVLKVTSGRSLEHLSLARAQHTHIVPLYSVHDDSERGLKALCMPYFGGASLWQLLDEMADTPVEKRSGRELLAALDRLQAAAQVQLIARGPGRRILERATYVQAIVWVGACLAEALHYAHERRLVHLDVKPSNVLIAADGQPMLLDFHLAQEPIIAGEKIVRPLGGTPAYMAPEQRAAVEAARADRPVPIDVGVTADVYSLGLTLYEALGGPQAQPSGDAPARIPLPKLNPDVPLSIADLIERCLAPKASGRYQDASQVATDLRRHLSNLPLLGVANRSLAERWKKWRRHRPYALYAWVAVSAVVFLTVWSVLQAVRRSDDHVDRAVAALAKGHQQAHQGRYADALESFAKGQALIGEARGHDALSEQFHQASRDALRLQTADQLRRLVGRLRLLEGAELSADARRSVEGRCQALWDDRARIVERLRWGDDDLSPQIRAELLDLALLLTDLQVPLASSRDQSAARGTVILDQAEALVGRNPVLDYERRRYAADSGSATKGAADVHDVELPGVTSAWEHMALGRSLLRQSRAGEAMPHLVRAVELAPDDLWPRFYKGLCAFRLGQPEHALAEFTACIALAPDEPTLWFHRALANTVADDVQQAIDDYSEVLKRDPSFRQAEVNRAKLRARANRR